MTGKPTPMDFHVIWSLDRVTSPDGPSVEMTKGSVTVTGSVPRPSVTDGWELECVVVPTDEGLSVRELSLRPSKFVWENGMRRERTEDEYNIDIDSTVLKRINLTRVRDQYRAEVDALIWLNRSNEREHERWKQSRKVASKQRRKRAVNNPGNMYRFAQDVLEESGNGRGIRRRLSERWNVSTEAVKSRMSLLRSEGWIDGSSTRALRGPSFLRYEQQRNSHKTKDKT